LAAASATRTWWGSAPHSWGRRFDAPAFTRAAAGKSDVVTDSQGRFTLSDIEAGTYRLTIAANGFVRQEYGQRVFPGQGTSFVLTTGQAMKDIQISMIPGKRHRTYSRCKWTTCSQDDGAVAHAVFDSAGRKSFQSVGSGKTDDRGEYRIYWVTPGRYLRCCWNYGLPAGAVVHYVTMSSNGPATITSNSASSPNEVAGEPYPMTFYPGVSDVRAGTVVEVPSGST
jgi:hypothetical protein